MLLYSSSENVGDTTVKIGGTFGGSSSCSGASGSILKYLSMVD